MLRVLRYGLLPFSRVMLSSDDDLTDFDFCRRCYGMAPSEHKILQHEFSHLMVVRSMWLHPFRREWIKFRAHMVKMRLLGTIKMNAATLLPSSEQNTPKGDPESDRAPDLDNLRGIGACARCAVQIVDWKSQFYICAEYSCAKEGKRCVAPL